VLSYLQGLTNQEVAAELGCPVGTIFTRLARGREMLRLRLVRRGVTLSTAVLGTALSQTAPTALSAELVKTTVQTALAFAAGSAAAVAPHVAVLTEGVLKMMWLTKVKLIVAVLVMAVAAGAGAGLLVMHATARETDESKKEATTDQKPAAETRRPAREALRYGGKTFEDWHNTLVIDLKPEVRAEAIKALSAFGANGYAREAVPIIVEAMRGYYMAEGLGDDQLVVNAARDGLGKIGAEAAMPVLVAEIKRGKRNGRLFALNCLDAFASDEAKPAILAVIEAIKDEAVPIRIKAIETLQRIDREASSTAAIAAVLTDKAFGVRWAAIGALAQFGSKAKEATPLLLAACSKDESASMRKVALQTLQRVKPSAQEFLPTLKDALRDADYEVRTQAIEALGRLGAEAKDAVPQLIEALKKTHEGNELMLIAVALGNIGPSAKAAVPALTEILKSQEGSAQTRFTTEIIRALEKINK
jgi:HEAT repeat protein